MIFINTNDFFRKASEFALLKREEELIFAEQMKAGDSTAREKLVNGYLPFVADYVRHLPVNLQTLDIVYRCCHALEKAVDTFDFLQNSERFSHRLRWWMRQTVTQYISDK